MPSSINPSSSLARPFYTSRILAIAMFVIVLMSVVAQAQQVNSAEPAFVPREALNPIANIELMDQVIVSGHEVTLAQISRWSKRDGSTFEPLADFIVVRLATDEPFATIELDHLRRLLRDAGANLATINFAGATTCTASRSDKPFDERDALEKWAQGKADDGPAPDDHRLAAILASSVVTDQAAARNPVGSVRSVVDDSPVATPVSLRDTLIRHLSSRIQIPLELLEVEFRESDRKILSLTSPRFEFEVKPQRIVDLGEVSWSVNVRSGGTSQRVQLRAFARAWREQVVTTRPIGFKQELTSDSLMTRRILVDRLEGDTLVSLENAIGQQAARDLKPGTVVIGKLLSPIDLARPGQLITVIMRKGDVEIRSVARAAESGTFGQAVKVKNESTRQEFVVTLTGPQMAELR